MRKMTKLPKFSALLKRLFKSRLFLQNFFLLTGVMTLIFLAFSLYTYRRSQIILEKEFTASAQYHLESTAQAVDNFIMDTRLIAATLDTNQMVRAFFAYENPDMLYTDFDLKIQETLRAYVNGYSAINSIYLYSQCSQSILTATECSNLTYFRDLNWMAQFTESDSDSFQIFFRAKNNSYPYLLCIMKQLKVNNYDAAIIINLNLSKLSYLINTGNAPYQDVYLVSDKGDIVYRNCQRELEEPLSIIPELTCFLPDKDTRTLLVSDTDSPYTYVQIPSSQYPWYYVTVTHLQEYASRLSNTRTFLSTLILSLFFMALLLGFFFSFRSVKPIQNLLSFLQHPQGSLSSDLYDDKEIGYIADQITSYIQRNQALSDELSSRLNLLNETKLLALQSQINPHFLFNTLNMIHILESEALGYDHKIPKITLNLGKLLRYALESTDLVELETEIEYTKLYISILQERYGGKPAVIYNLDENALRAKVPKLFIQPIIENAIFHGLAECMDENSSLTLSCKYLPGSSSDTPFCQILIQDNGVGMSPETLLYLRQISTDSTPLKGSIGLRNTITRMNLLYGEQFRLEIDSTPRQGSSFTLTFPVFYSR